MAQIKLSNSKFNDKSASWRDTLPIHPAARLLPRTSPDELRILGKDIVKNGLNISIALWRSDPKAPLQLLDGISRLDALELVTGPVKVEPPNVAGKDFLASNMVVVLEGSVDPYAYVISSNLHRRHLTAEQKRELIAALIKTDPEKSNRQIAKQVKADHKTVGTVRDEMEGRGEIPHVERCKDTKGRKQPAHRKSKSSTAESPATAPQFAGEFGDLLAAKAGDWTGATVGTQAEVDAAIERLRDDGAAGHWLVVAPRECVVVDHRVIQWLLLTAPSSSVIPHMEWAFALCDAADKARCPVWVSERLTGKPHRQRPGMAWPRELPIPQQTPRDDIGPSSAGELQRLQTQIDELHNKLRRHEFENLDLKAENAGLKAAAAKPQSADYSELAEALARIAPTQFLAIMPSDWWQQLETHVIERLSAARLVGILESQLERECMALNVSAPLQKIRELINQSKPPIDLDATPVEGSA